MLHSTVGIISLYLTSSIFAASASFGHYAYAENIGELQIYFADGESRALEYYAVL